MMNSSRIPPLTNASYYPRLTEVAADTAMHRLESAGERNLDRLLVSSPLLGPPEDILQMLISDGSVRANLISLCRGDLQPLEVKIHKDSKTDYEVSLPDGRQLGFHRGLPGSGRLAIWVVQGDARLQVDFSDTQKRQPELASVSLESIVEESGPRVSRVFLTQGGEMVGDRDLGVSGFFMTR